MIFDGRLTHPTYDPETIALRAEAAFRGSFADAGRNLSVRLSAS